MKLTREHKRLLRELRGGADVWGRREAELCRELERAGLVKICAAMASPPGHKQQPYFGAVSIEGK